VKVPADSKLQNIVHHVDVIDGDVANYHWAVGMWHGVTLFVVSVQKAEGKAITPSAEHAAYHFAVSRGAGPSLGCGGVAKMRVVRMIWKGSSITAVGYILPI